MLESMLNRNTVLQTLSLRDNSLEVHSMTSVGRGLCNNEGSLTRLDLFGQRCGSEAVCALMRHVSNCQHLLSLNVGMSDPGEEGDMATGSMLRQNTVLAALDFAHNQRAQHVLAAMVKCTAPLEVSPHLPFFSFPFHMKFIRQAVLSFLCVCLEFCFPVCVWCVGAGFASFSVEFSLLVCPPRLSCCVRAPARVLLFFSPAGLSSCVLTFFASCSCVRAHFSSLLFLALSVSTGVCFLFVRAFFPLGSGHLA